MGIFFNNRLTNFKAIKEAEADGTDLNPNNEEKSTDYTAEEESPEETQQSDDSGNESENTEENTNEESGEEETTDYTAMDGEMDMGDGDETGDDNSTGNSDSSSGSDSGDEEKQPVDDIKTKEEELYGDLTPEQLDVKHKELKTQFLEMYDIVVSIIERIGNISVSDISVIEYVSNTLSNLKDMLTDYMDSIYATKSYTENLVNYNRFLATLNGVSKILEEIDKKND